VITGKTRLLAIVGDPIDKARSPESFCQLLEMNGHDAIMIPVHVTSADLPQVLAGLKAMRNLDGIVATMPHKVAMAAFADEVLETGRLVGAVNALRRRSDGRWEADMFDGRGFVAGLRAHGHDPAGARVALIGAGGAGSAIAVSLCQAGIAALSVHELDAAKASRLTTTLRTTFSKVGVRAGAPISRSRASLSTPRPSACSPAIPCHGTSRGCVRAPSSATSRRSPKSRRSSRRRAPRGRPPSPAATCTRARCASSVLSSAIP
jgi:shikimate dehydrogenase